MYKTLGIYSGASVLESIVTHPIEIARIRYVNRTNMWRGIRGVYPGIGVQLMGIIPNRIAFLGSKEYAVSQGYRWWEYAPLSTVLQTMVSVPFQSWRTARAESIPLHIRPYGVIPLFMRNLIFANCFFAAKDELPKKYHTPSVMSTVIGVSTGVIVSHPLDVIRISKQSIHRDKTYPEIIRMTLDTGNKEGYFRTLWRGCLGRLCVACVGITTMVESMEMLKCILN